MREVANITERKLFRDDAEIELAIQLAKGNMIESQEINAGLAQHMIEGETRVDMNKNRNVTKVNGKIYKEVVKDNEVVFEEIV